MVKDRKDYVAFTKSIGSVLALKNIFEKTLNPKKLVICGYPYRAAKDENLPIDEYLKSLTVPTMFIQNEFDPVYSFEELEETLKENSPTNYQLVKNMGNNTHDYDNCEKLALITREFFETN